MSCFASPAAAGHRLRPEDEPELPEQIASLAERVAGPALDERLERVVGKRCPASQCAELPEGPVGIPLRHERLRILLPHRLHICQPDAHGKVTLWL